MARAYQILPVIGVSQLGVLVQLHIAMYLTLCAMLLRCSAMCLLGGGCDVRWIASGMCDPVLISTLPTSSYSCTATGTLSLNTRDSRYCTYILLPVVLPFIYLPDSRQITDTVQYRQFVYTPYKGSSSPPARLPGVQLYSTGVSLQPYRMHRISRPLPRSTDNTTTTYCSGGAIFKPR